MKIGFLILNAYLQCVSYDSFHTVTPCHSGWVETSGKQQAAGCGHQCDGQTSLGRIQIFTQTVISALYQLTQGIGALAEKLREDFCLLLTLELTSLVTCSYRLHGLPCSHLQEKNISQDALRVNGSEALLPRFRFSLEKSKKKNLIKHGGGGVPTATGQSAGSSGTLQSLSHFCSPPFHDLSGLHHLESTFCVSDFIVINPKSLPWFFSLLG